MASMAHPNLNTGKAVLEGTILQCVQNVRINENPHNVVAQASSLAQTSAFSFILPKSQHPTPSSFGYDLTATEVPSRVPMAITAMGRNLKIK